MMLADPIGEAVPEGVPSMAWVGVGAAARTAHEFGYEGLSGPISPVSEPTRLTRSRHTGGGKRLNGFAGLVARSPLTF